MIKLLIADDHGILRAGLKQLFEMVDDIEVVGEAVNGEEVINAVAKQEIDVLMLDLTMPGVSGVELVEEIRRIRPKLPILVLSMHDTVPIVRQIIRAGANGYVSKATSEPRGLLSAIHAVAVGGHYLDPQVAQRLAFESNVEPVLKHKKLSARELQIFKMLAAGASLGEIAQKLFISDKTVSSHKARLMAKMDFKTNAEIVRYAIDKGLLDD